MSFLLHEDVKPFELGTLRLTRTVYVSSAYLEYGGFSLIAHLGLKFILFITAWA